MYFGEKKPPPGGSSWIVVVGDGSVSIRRTSNGRIICSYRLYTPAEAVVAMAAIFAGREPPRNLGGEIPGCVNVEETAIANGLPRSNDHRVLDTLFDEIQAEPVDHHTV